MKNKNLPIFLSKLGLLLAILGPGLITASAGNDAPGIATYSMVGSKYGYSFLWIIVAITVGQITVQEIAARMGAVTGKGTADLIREKFGVKIAAFAMFTLLIANLGTTFAQFAGIAAAGELFGISKYITVPFAAIVISLLILNGKYKHVEKVLLFLCLSALSYVITVFINKPDWGVIARQALTPEIKLDSQYILTMLAVIGTTITPWGIFYLQASIADKGVELNKYNNTKIDVVFGSAWGNTVSAFIIITTASTLFFRGIVVEGVAEAALALEPLAGVWSSTLFAIGLVGASLLAISVLPLSTTYAMCEAFGFERGLNRPVKEAPVFYTMFSIITLLSMVVALIPGVPLFQMMVLSQSMNGILLPILLVLILILANDKQIMGKWKNKPLTNVMAISMTVMLFCVTLLLFAGELFNFG